MTYILLAFSVVINIFLFWYVVQLLRRFLAFQEDLDEFAVRLEEYEGHVTIIHDMERFYGDATLANLLHHSKVMTEECKQFQNILGNQEEEEYGEDEE